MRKIILIILLFVGFTSVMGQVELVSVEHRVYDFLRRMDVSGLLEDYNPAQMPISRRKVGEMLREIQNSELRMKNEKTKLNKNDRMMLGDFCKEFEYELRVQNSEFRIKNEGLKERDSFQEHEGMTGLRKDWVNDNKYIVSYTDTNVAVWGHLTGGLYQRNGVGDSVGARKFLAGDLGFEVRGTMFDRVGFAMSYSNGRAFVGNAEDKIFANTFDPFFRTAVSLKDDGKFFDHFKGYVRYEVPKRWLALMVGNENVKQGFGFVDNLFFSGIEPYPMIKLDLKYKAVSYTFSYGNIEDDSLGVISKNKMISTHRLDVKFAKWLRGGFYESVITNYSAFTFVHLNPFSFITSADLNRGAAGQWAGNTFMGFDVEVKPVKNVVVQGTFLIDDFNMASIGNSDYTANDNKFGYQAGVMWNDAFTIDGLSGVVEYTRLDPFVYAHHDNTLKFTNWGLSMGHQLPPNSDEWAFKFDYNVLARLNVGVLFQFQRSGEGFTYDSLGNVDINYGGNINHGERFFATIKNKFLQGDRVNRSIVGVSMRWEPVRQWGVEVKYFYKYQNLIYASRKVGDSFYYLNLFLKI
ncbi:MAG: hypothetical protein NTY74_10905 [Ignavibacteriae bacterium]|nr:hypothetical protein [Ignavibacteriota bacterium]